MDESNNNNDEWDTHLKHDSMKPCWDKESEGEGMGEDEQCKDNDNCGMEDMDNEGFHVNMMALTVEIGDDPQDKDWILESLRMMLSEFAFCKCKCSCLPS